METEEATPNPDTENQDIKQPTDQQPKPEKPSKTKKNKLLIVIAVLLVILIVLMVIPATRYKLKAMILGQASVQILVQDKISGSPINGAVVKYNGKDIKPSAAGVATVNVPASASSVSVGVMAPNFHDASVDIKVSKSHQNQSSIDMLHSGNIYFLSKNSNNGADIIESNLDGSVKKVVLLGTSTDYNSLTNPIDVVDTYYEGPSLLAAKDWQHLAYLANRSPGVKESGKTHVGLYIFDTAKKQLTEIDKTNSFFEFIGWIDNQHFVYHVSAKNSQATAGANTEAIKVYDVSSGKATTLLANKVNQDFGAQYLINGKIIMALRCLEDTAAECKKAGIPSEIVALSIDAKVTSLKDFGDWKVGQFTNNIYNGQLYYTVYGDGQNGGTAYLSYNGQKINNSDDKQANQQAYHAPLSSPSGSSAFWTESNKGSNILYTSNKDGSSSSESLAAPFKQYGWYTDNYNLLSKDGNTLYITGQNSSKTPVQISSYTAATKGYNIAMAGYPGPGFGYGDLQ